MPTVTFQMIGQQLPTRYWLLNTAESDLIQVQPDRFGYSWRRQTADADYPRYQHVRSRFDAAFSEFLDTLDKLGKVVSPTWCEISYVNSVAFGKPGQPRRDLSSILRRVSAQYAPSLPRPDNTQLSERFLLSHDNKPFARFYFAAEPTFIREGNSYTLGYRIGLQMRGLPETADRKGILAFFDEGRSLIVESFRDMTTSNMHKVWGLR